MEKAKRKFSEEMKRFFKSASDFSRKNNFTEISIGGVISEIFKCYLVNREGEDKRLRDWSTKIKDVESFMRSIQGLISTVSSDIPDSYCSVDPILSDEFEDLFKVIEIRNDLIDCKGKEIDAVDFLSGIVTSPSKTGKDFSKILSDIGLNCTELVEISLSDANIDDMLNNIGNYFSSSKYSVNKINFPPKSESKKDDTSSSFSDEEFEKAGETEAVNSKKFDPDSKTPYLDQFSFPMSIAAKEGKYDPVVGRDKEISQIIEILCCRKKNNAVLLGDPGCGKTAVVEGLVQKINKGDVPRELKDKKIYSLDLNALVSGTKYRGEYEQRLQEIIKEVCSNPDVIIYIDEFHNLVGNGGSAGNGDGANILKPYLARGEFQCIGSTTVDEYRKFVEKDGALKRRFQNVQINEPTPDETVDILRNLSDQYSKYHKVNYTDEVIQACVDWSGRYITDRFFPDKAIDCLDMSGSLAKLEKSLDYSILTKLEEELIDLNEKEAEYVKDLDFEKGNDILNKKKVLLKRIEKTKNTLKSKEENPKNWPTVTIKNVAAVVSKISKVPVDKINQTDLEKLKSMKDSLEKKVIGQEEAVSKVVLNLQRNFLGLRDENKPIATMLFVGPTGTGKSLICKEIAKEFFGSEKSLIRFDMGEFGERHEVTKLTGSTASYVGYDDTPLLEQVRRNPYSVVLFDEIEKAAPEIYNIFLNILDEGSVTLGNGVKVDFKNTIIIFTGNIGTKELSIKGDGIGFSKITAEGKKKEITDIVIKAVKKEFKPEFINRLSSITVFNELTKDKLNLIFDLELSKLSERLSRKGISIEVSNSLKNKIISECDTNFGARDLQRNITKWIEDEICNSMLTVKSINGIEKAQLDIDKFENVKVKFIKKTKPKKDKVISSSPINSIKVSEEDSDKNTSIVEEENNKSI